MVYLAKANWFVECEITFELERSLKKFFARSRFPAPLPFFPRIFCPLVALSINCFRRIRCLSPLPPCSRVPQPASRDANCILRSYIVIKPSSTSCSLMSVTVVLVISSFNLLLLFFSPPSPLHLFFSSDLHEDPDEGPLEVRLRLPGFLCRPSHFFAIDIFSLTCLLQLPNLLLPSFHRLYSVHC